MYNRFKALVIGFLVVVGLNACSASSSTTTTSGSGNYPSWYAPSGFSSDSVSFHGYAMAVSSDSVIAIANAELQARADLESSIAKKLENVREQMEDDDISVATEPLFILTLRNAHQAVQDQASSTSGSARKQDGYYRGYAQVSISKSDLKKLLASGFSGKTTYWNSFSTSATYTQELQ